jgi:hypothetical protein
MSSEIYGNFLLGNSFCNFEQIQITLGYSPFNGLFWFSEGQQRLPFFGSVMERGDEGLSFTFLVIN